MYNHIRKNDKKRLALAIVLGLCLSTANYAWAATAGDGTTYADGNLSYSGEYSSSATSIFKGWQDGTLKQNNDSYMGIKSGEGPSFWNGSTHDRWVDFTSVMLGPATNKRKLDYDTIICVMPDGTRVDVSNNKEWNVMEKLPGDNGYIDVGFARDVNEAYWENPLYQAEIAAALNSGDLSLLVHLPKFIGIKNGTETNLKTRFGIRPVTYTFSSKPADSSYSYSYDKATAAESGIWRPMDRLKESGSAMGGDITTKSKFGVDENGNITFLADDQCSQGTNDKIEINNTANKPVHDPTFITVKELEVGKNGVVDLVYLNTYGSNPLVNSMVGQKPGGFGSTLNYDGRYRGPNGEWGALNRSLLIDKATLADGATFRLGSYGTGNNSSVDDNASCATLRQSDSVYINTATAQSGGKTKLYVELGWVPGVGKEVAGQAVCDDSHKFDEKAEKSVMVGILNGAENFDVEGRTSMADGIFSQYEITPVLGRIDDFFNLSGARDENLALIGEQGTAWYLQSYHFEDTGATAESGMAAADNSIATNNLWKTNYLNMFRRVGTLHRDGYNGEADKKENAWADVWHGKFDSASGYGRKVGQSYDGVQVGYDKLLNHDYYGGKAYAGFYLMKADGKSHTATGGGEQDTLGGGLYGAWVGLKGHYFDIGLTAARLGNEYDLQANVGTGEVGTVTAAYHTWAYGLGAQYGYHHELKNGWFLEPSAALFIGHVDEANYVLSNKLGIAQKGYDTVTGKVGLTAGRSIGDTGNVYASLAAVREFTGERCVDQFYGDRQRALDASGGKDTRWEFNLGGNVKISPTGALNLNLVKTAGGSVGDDWSINGGLNWTWDGIGGKVKKAADAPTDERTSPSVAPVQRDTTVVIGAKAADKSEAQGSRMAADSGTGSSTVMVVSREKSPNTVVNAAAAAVTGDLPVYMSPADGDFVLTPVTVEAKRPDWEKTLSPGQVSVIYPEHFKGEQKDLPELLERVPGLFVQRTNGAGHYTVARVRGATAAQVNLYVDGVLMNLNGDAAVNLSIIPVDNVERIEVYRGYVPARFSGSPLGGVINIVTKKPQEAGGRITQGMKSYGGYTGSYEYTTPLGSGSLLATYNRDIWGGDFPFGVYDVYKRSYLGDFERRSNGYQNNNGLLKWQDDHWMLKASWKKMHEQIPKSVNRLTADDAITGSQAGQISQYQRGLFDADQEINQKEFQVGRRDTVGNLDWGWRLSYLDSKKSYRATGLLNSDDPYYQYNPNDSKLQYFTPGTHFSDYHSKKFGGNINGAFKMGDSHLLEFNGEFSREGMDAGGSYWKEYKENIFIHSQGFAYLPHYDIREYHLTLQDTITLNAAGDFKLTPVLRADKVEMETLSDDDHSWKYSAGMALQKALNDNWSVKTTWGTYNRHPNFYEIFGDGATIRQNEGAANLFAKSGKGTWESGEQFDFSLNWQGDLLAADTDTVLTWFQRKSKNQLALWIPNVPFGANTYFPMDESKVHGLELTHTMKWDRLSLNLAGTWQKSEYTDSKMESGRKTSISYTPEWIWNARLEYLLPGDKLTTFIEYKYTDKQFLGDYDGTNESTSQYLTDFSSVDLGLKYKFDSAWRLSAGVNDIFNKGYDVFQYNNYVGSIGLDSVETAAYPLTGRTYYMTMEYSF